VPGLGGIWQSEHDFRDKHASQFTTGRFVLLPKNLVTGAAKARIVIVRPRRVGPHRQLKPRLSRGFFLADAHDASHFEAGALVAWALPPWRRQGGLPEILPDHTARLRCGFAISLPPRDELALRAITGPTTPRRGYELRCLSRALDHASRNANGALRDNRYHAAAAFMNISGNIVPPVNRSTIGYCNPSVVEGSSPLPVI